MTHLFVFISILLSLLFGPKINAQQNETLADYLDSFPKPVHWANDMENIYSSAQLKMLDSLLNNFERKSSVQIKLVTIDSSFAAKYKFDLIVHKLDNWNIGKNAFADTADRNTYNCIFFFLSKWEGRVQVFSESAWYGIGEVLKNTESNPIVEEAMYALWRKEDYFEATLKGLGALMKRIDEALKEKEIVR